VSRTTSAGRVSAAKNPISRLPAWCSLIVAVAGSCRSWQPSGRWS